MTKAIGNWSSINFGEGKNLELDFTDGLAEGDSVASITAWKISVSEGDDPNKDDRILTPFTVSGNKTQQRFIAPATGAVRIVYLLQAVGLSTQGEPLNGWSYIGVLPLGGCDDGC